MKRRVLLSLLFILLALISACSNSSLSDTKQPGKNQSINNISQIYMINRQIGWSIQDQDVLRTLDGGDNWFKVTPTEVSISPGQYFFLDEQTAWIANGKEDGKVEIFHTTNGGSSWRKEVIAAPGVAPKITFANPSNGWLLTSIKRTMYLDSVQIFRTTDGGSYWESILDSYKDSVANLPLEGQKIGLKFIDSQGWIPLHLITSETPWLYRSNDGGENWRKQVIPSPEGETQEPINYTMNNPLFFTENDGIMVVDYVVGNQYKTAFYTSNDGGDTWNIQSKLNRNVSSGSMIYDFVDRNIGWASDGKQLYSTNNGALSWKKAADLSQLSPTLSVEDSVIQIEFVDELYGWLLTVDPNNKFQMFKTNNGGKNWTAAIPQLLNQPATPSVR